MPQIEGPLLQREDFDFIRALDKNGSSIKVPKNYFTVLHYRGAVENLNATLYNGLYSYGLNTENRPRESEYGHLIQVANKDNATPGVVGCWITQIAIGTDLSIRMRQVINSDSWTKWTLIFNPYV